jgi:hypothetical protein
MIELTREQSQAMDDHGQPPAFVDPRTGQEYMLIKREVYNLVSGILEPYNRNWDPDDDLIRKDA